MSAKILRQQIADAIDDLMVSQADSDQLAEAVAAYLLTERRTKELDAIMRAVAQNRKRRGIFEAEITSAFNLEPDIKERLKDIIRQSNINAKKIIARTNIDSSLTGGVVLETDDLRLDASIRSRLRKLITNT